jgi:hypothetical protein
MRTLFILLFTLAVSVSLLAQKPAWEAGPGHITLRLWPHPQAGTAAEVDATTANDI